MSKVRPATDEKSLTKFEEFFSRFKKPILILLIGFCLVIGFISFKLMMADIKGYQAKRMIERWEKHDKITSQEDLDHAYINIEKARWWAPDYPKFIQYEALILKWHATSPEYLDNAVQSGKLLRASLDRYEQELVQRPTWPYAWSAYANTKLMLGEIDEKFAFALDRAFFYGPWESQVQLEIIRTGLSAWPELSLDSKKLVFKTLGYAFQGNKFIKDILSLSKEKNIFAVVCMMPDHEKYMNHIQKQCKQALSTFKLTAK